MSEDLNDNQQSPDSNKGERLFQKIRQMAPDAAAFLAYLNFGDTLLAGTFWVGVKSMFDVMAVRQGESIHNNLASSVVRGGIRAAACLASDGNPEIVGAVAIAEHGARWSLETTGHVVRNTLPEVARSARNISEDAARFARTATSELAERVTQGAVGISRVFANKLGEHKLQNPLPGLYTDRGLIDPESDEIVNIRKWNFNPREWFENRRSPVGITPEAQLRKLINKTDKELYKEIGRSDAAKLLIERMKQGFNMSSFDEDIDDKKLEYQDLAEKTRNKWGKWMELFSNNESPIGDLEKDHLMLVALTMENKFNETLKPLYKIPGFDKDTYLLSKLVILKSSDRDDMEVENKCLGLIKDEVWNLYKRNPNNLDLGALYSQLELMLESV